ncbi:3-methyladenine DNA glycosylase AlkD [Streptosporangium becharense]|uniref:3-methyladenine DNA glycosylase AlkD n=1 Tax=Streptosporangium becharense TaxID=1816182 RepID=A0A7W9MFU1_9ACTN|nr:DNA alkylation repair protein [Streptosporangium becharense]MBB2912314.1 3-methyladenine DNA glycosylase AlkD [Streptosporangium becharense]MBB5818861.1 3-methyladenine DNA glycosylase AlkD [Streptosporangium becharense]
METLRKAVRMALTDVADPAKAPAMQAYMKSSMPFLGVQAVPRRAALRRVFAERPFDDAPGWRGAVLELWREAEYREERYAAIELTGFRRYRGFQTTETLPMYEEMIVTGAWWDYVDDLAVHRIGGLLAAFPDTMRPLVLRWAHDDDLWKRRTAILCQNRFKSATDTGLLYACIAPSLSDTHFFARKAIGWALREYAKTNPGEVLRYVDHTGIAGLSRREALKNLRVT